VKLAQGLSVLGLQFADTPGAQDDLRLAEVAGMKDDAETARAAASHAGAGAK
jgi:hypothetical protein